MKWKHRCDWQNWQVISHLVHNSKKKQLECLLRNSKKDTKVWWNDCRWRCLLQAYVVSHISADGCWIHMNQVDVASNWRLAMQFMCNLCVYGEIDCLLNERRIGSTPKTWQNNIISLRSSILILVYVLVGVYLVGCETIYDSAAFQFSRKLDQPDLVAVSKI